MQVEIKNIKNIVTLSFELPTSGVWILTGLNGGGKTSLLAAIYRIRAQNAFQKYYRTGSPENNLDSYDQSSIKYTINSKSVLYKYGGQRWRATPRKDATILTMFPYETIEYIDANANRIEPFSDEIKPTKLLPAKEEIKQFIKGVLDDEKWLNLQYVNTRRGRGNDAYLISYQKGNKTYYFSEKGFSLGELCVFKLAKKISSVPNKSLLLIDEIEMALHPQAQVRLVKKIIEVANQKDLTVIFSTHSSTIIKNTRRKNLIYLKDDGNGNIEPIKEAYPAQILGDVAFYEELTADFIFFVEDDEAQTLLQAIIAKYLSKYNEQRSYQPLYRIVPVGGCLNVIQMLTRASSIFPSYVQQFVFLDADVKSETLGKARQDNNRKVIDLFDTAPQGKIHYLPCTPELGFIEMIENVNNTAVVNQIGALFDGYTINLNIIMNLPIYSQHTSDKPRLRAKKRMLCIVENISQQTGFDCNLIRRTLYKAYVDDLYGREPQKLPQMLGPIFNNRTGC